MKGRCVHLAAALASALVLAGCDGTDISNEVSSRLEIIVDEAWEAAQDGDAAASARHLDRLRRELAGLVRAGELSEERALEILLAADQAEALLSLLEQPAEEPEQPAEEPEEPGPGDGRGRGNDGRGRADGNPGRGNSGPGGN